MPSYCKHCGQDYRDGHALDLSICPDCETEAERGRDPQEVEELCAHGTPVSECGSSMCVPWTDEECECGECEACVKADQALVAMGWGCE